MLARLMHVIDRILALAFIAAVCLNFANVVGRYGFGRSIPGADEVQIYIMVWMAFLGAVLVSWRDDHLRMDVLMKIFPDRVKRAVRAFETAVLVALTLFVLVQSARYVAQMVRLDLRSDVAGIPMWIPHSAVAAGFGLIALIALWRAARRARA